MEVPIELDRNEAIKIPGLLWNPWSYQFLIIDGTCIQICGSLKTLLLVKVIVFSIASAIFDTFALISPNECVCCCSVEQPEYV
jgi:hypothetical protein